MSAAASTDCVSAARSGIRLDLTPPTPERGGESVGDDLVPDDAPGRDALDRRTRWEPDMSRTCPGCGCKPIDTNGRCPRCRAVKRSPSVDVDPSRAITAAPTQTTQDIPRAASAQGAFPLAILAGAPPNVPGWVDPGAPSDIRGTGGNNGPHVHTTTETR